MKNLELKVIEFNGSDVIATSGLLLANVGDGDPTNNTFGGRPLSEYAGWEFIDVINGYNNTGAELGGQDDNCDDSFNGTYYFRDGNYYISGDFCDTLANMGYDNGAYVKQ